MGFGKAWLGHLCHVEGDLPGARTILEANRAVLVADGDAEACPHTSVFLGMVLLDQGEVVRSRELLAEAVASKSPRLQQWDLLELVAELVRVEGRPVGAAKLLGAADAERSKTGFARELFTWYRARTDELLRSSLGDEAFERALAEGRELSLDEAIEIALTPPERTRDHGSGTREEADRDAT